MNIFLGKPFQAVIFLPTYIHKLGQGIPYFFFVVKVKIG